MTTHPWQPGTTRKLAQLATCVPVSNIPRIRDLALQLHQMVGSTTTDPRDWVCREYPFTEHPKSSCLALQSSNRHDGLEVVEVLPDPSPEDGAAAEGGEGIDPGPYHRFDEATDAFD